MPAETLIDFFGSLSGNRGDFLIYDDGYRSRRYSYAQVTRAARAFAARLQAAGIRKGEKVLLWGENGPEWLVAFWGCLLAGGVVVPIEYRSSPDFFRKVRQIVEARLVLVGDEVIALDVAASGAADSLEGVPVWLLAEIDWNDSRQPIPTPIEPGDTAEILFTSGATAEPKGVVITHRNILANIASVEQEVSKYRRYLRLFFPLRFLNLLPLSHMFGQAMATFLPPLLQGTTVFVRGHNPEEIVRQIKKWKISVLVCVPKMLEVLRGHVLRLFPQVAQIPRRERHPILRWLRYRKVHHLFGLKFWSFVVGAAPLNRALEEFWSRLGFMVIQGYGLTETAPIVSLNLPFDTEKGSVGKPIAGVEVKIAQDGEILVRGENVSPGYYQAPSETSAAFEDGWLHTGDIGKMDETGRLFVRGRTKEMIVTPEGLNVFPGDVERVLNDVEGVRESAVVGLASDGEERVHAVLLLERDVEPEEVLREANARLEDSQKIRGMTVWPGSELPRTAGTRKLKRREIQQWVVAGAQPRPAPASQPTVEGILCKYVGDRRLARETTIEELGLTSLERLELLVSLEERFQTRIDEVAFASLRDLSELRELVDRAQTERSPTKRAIDFPSWNREALVRAVRRVGLAVWILPFVRLFARLRVEGRETLESVSWPVIFASNHQSGFDVPVILAALPRRWRARVSPAMAKEFFEAHFFPEKHTRWQRFVKSLDYYLAALFVGAFPLPTSEAGARDALRYMGELLDDGFSVLIFPEGSRTEAGEIKPFRPGVGMVASRLDVPVVPVRLEGLDRVLHQTWKLPRSGPVRVAFGAPLRLKGEDYSALAKRVEEAVRGL